MALGNPIKRSRLARRPAHTGAQKDIYELAQQLAQAGSRIEAQFWESRLLASISLTLNDGDERTLTAVLDALQDEENRAYEPVIDLIEYAAESLAPELPAETQIVLIAIPILAWSRFQVPSGNIPTSVLADLRVHVKAHLLAAEAKLGLMDVLLSPDQLPQSYAETYKLLQRLTPAAIHDRDLQIDAQQLPETANFLSDVRYILAAVVTPRGNALFHWQEAGTSRESAYKAWVEQGGAVLRRLLPACAVEFVAPGAFHSAIRQADKASRPYALQAGVAFLQTLFNFQASKLSAVVGGYYDRDIEEYRISLLEQGTNDVLHGVVWPILDAEDENGEALAQIEACLRQCGISDVAILEQRLPLEFCDDCGAPLYPNREGEPTHVELPEESEHAFPGQLH
jgi:hypothetical protein